MLAIIDYGMGNIKSIANMIRKIGAEAKTISSPEELRRADKVILPGVGAFDNGMKNLKDLGLISVLNDVVLNKKIPVLGICLGMQLFTKKSEEGKLDGLGWIDAETIRFRFDRSKENLKIPHMGWNTVKIKKESRLFDNMYPEPRFYFIHSYHLICNDEKDVLTETFYGYNFVSSVQRDNIFGVQFHPEKSHKFGMQILKNFVELCC